jgi:hypothetical protein
LRYPEGLPTRDPSRSCIIFSKAGFYIDRPVKIDVSWPYAHSIDWTGQLWRNSPWPRR